MAIFLEGPDLAGKTTLAHRLTERLGRKYIKETVYGKAVFDVYRKHLRMGTDVIVDRSYFSEVIYPSIHKTRRCKLTTEELWYLALLTMRRGGAHIILCPEDVTLRMRYGAHGNGKQRLTEILRLVELYRRIPMLWWVPIEAIIIIHGDAEGAKLERALEFAEAYEQACADYERLIKHGWGARRRNKVLFVGDRPNVKGKNTDGLFLPLSARRRQTTAGYLYAMFRAGMLAPRDVHIINAYERDGTPHDGSVIALLQPRAIVALGKNAALWCMEHSPVPLATLQNRSPHPDAIPFYQSAHPAYLRRFWNHFATDFGYALGKELGMFNRRS